MTHFFVGFSIIFLNLFLNTVNKLHIWDNFEFVQSYKIFAWHDRSQRLIFFIREFY